jgi:peroxiredoxin
MLTAPLRNRSQTHLPGYVADRQKLADAGAEVVVCVR